MTATTPIALLAALLALAPAAFAAPAPRTTLGDVEDEVMCPVCGTPLSLASEAPQADRQRRFIVRLIEQGRSKQQIKAALVAEFGPGVLAVPEDDGFDLAAYLVPILALLGGAVAVALAWRRRPRRDGPADPSDAPPQAADAARLEADLERYEL